MAVDGSGRVHLLGRVRLLHPEQQTLDEMLDGWRNQQLSRNLKFDTIDQRIRYVRRFVDRINEFPWHWTRLRQQQDPRPTGRTRLRRCHQPEGLPLQAGRRSVVERTDSRHNRGFKKPATCASEQRGRVIEAFIALADTVIIP